MFNLWVSIYQWRWWGKNPFNPKMLVIKQTSNEWEVERRMIRIERWKRRKIEKRKEEKRVLQWWQMRWKHGVGVFLIYNGESKNCQRVYLILYCMGEWQENLWVVVRDSKPCFRDQLVIHWSKT